MEMQPADAKTADGSMEISSAATETTTTTDPLPTPMETESKLSDGSGCKSMESSSAGSKSSSGSSVMDISSAAKKTTTDPLPTPMETSSAKGSLTTTPVHASPSPPIAISEHLAAASTKPQLDLHLTTKGVKIFKLQCGCGENHLLLVSEGDVILIGR